MGIAMITALRSGAGVDRKGLGTPSAWLPAFFKYYHLTFYQIQHFGLYVPSHFALQEALEVGSFYGTFYR